MAKIATYILNGGNINDWCEKVHKSCGGIVTMLEHAASRRGSSTAFIEFLMAKGGKLSHHFPYRGLEAIQKINTAEKALIQKHLLVSTFDLPKEIKEIILYTAI